MYKQRNKDSRKVSHRKIDANNFNDKFTNMMSELAHEIHNIITPVYMTLQFILKNTSKPEQYRDNINHSIGMLNRLYDLLEEVRDSSYEKEIEKRAVFLKDTVDKVFLQNLKLLETKNIIFVNEIHESLKVLIDEDSFNQVLYNLFQNTMNCLSDSGIGMIRVNIEETNEQSVKMIYRNNGPPIPEGSLEKVFIPHFSISGRKKVLGLGISRKLMTKMGGAISAEAPERGGVADLFC